MLYLVLMLPRKLHPVVFYLEVIEVYPAAAVAYQRPLSAVPIGIEPLADGLLAVAQPAELPPVRRAVYRGGAALAGGYVGPADLIGIGRCAFCKSCPPARASRVSKRHTGQEQHRPPQAARKRSFSYYPYLLKISALSQAPSQRRGRSCTGKKAWAGYFGGAPFVGVTLRQHS